MDGPSVQVTLEVVKFYIKWFSHSECECFLTRASTSREFSDVSFNPEFLSLSNFILACKREAIKKPQQHLNG